MVIQDLFAYCLSVPLSCCINVPTKGTPKETVHSLKFVDCSLNCSISLRSLLKTEAHHFCNIRLTKSSRAHHTCSSDRGGCVGLIIKMDTPSDYDVGDCSCWCIAPGAVLIHSRIPTQLLAQTPRCNEHRPTSTNIFTSNALLFSSSFPFFHPLHSLLISLLRLILFLSCSFSFRPFSQIKLESLGSVLSSPKCLGRSPS